MHIVMAIADYAGYPPLSGAQGLIGLKAVLIEKSRLSIQFRTENCPELYYRAGNNF